MARFRAPALLALGLLASLAGSGCLASCDQLCAEEALYIDGCLEHWEALWPDLGYDGLRDVPDENGEAGTLYVGGPAEEYTERCQARYRASQYFSSIENGRTVRVRCAEDLALVADARGCTDYQPSDGELDPTEGDNGVAPRP